MKTIFDEIDRKILNILTNNGRETLTKISEQVAISNTSIKKRILKLYASGILKVQGNFNLEVMEFKACLILLEVKNFALLKKLAEAYDNCPYVFLTAEILGSFNLIIGFYGNSNDDLNFKLKYCGPTNKEGMLHSKIIMISDFKFPKYFPLQVSSGNNDGSNQEEQNCGFNCTRCEGFLYHQCQGCL